MDIFLTYLKVFAVGGAICAVCQLIIDKTKLTSSRIRVGLVTMGVLLSALGIYGPFAEFAKAGATVPLLGFGHSLFQGVLEGIRERGLLGVLTGGVTATAGGIAAAVFFGYSNALIFSSGTKK